MEAQLWAVAVVDGTGTVVVTLVTGLVDMDIALLPLLLLVMTSHSADMKVAAFQQDASHNTVQ